MNHDLLLWPEQASCAEDMFSGYLNELPRPRKAATPEPAGGTAHRPNGGSPPASAQVSGGAEYDLAVRQGRIVLPEYGVLEGDIYIKSGRIAALAHSGAAVLPARQEVHAGDRYILPGIIDPHVHLGLFTPLHKELETETAAALIGGVTTAGIYIKPGDSRPGAFDVVADQIHCLSYVDINPHFVITQVDQLAQVPEMISRYGIRAFKVYLHGVPGLIEHCQDSFFLELIGAMKASGEKCLLCVHCETHSLVETATQRVHSERGSEATLTDWEQTHPEMAEEEAIHRIAFYAQKMKQTVYIVHISSRGGARLLRELKKENPYLYGETTSPYLTLSLDDGIDVRAKMEPPLRDAGNQAELWRAVADGTIDTIGTDNVMVPYEQKLSGAPLWQIPSGYAVLETHLPSLLTEGVLHRGLPIQELVSKLTLNPARIFGLYPRKGTLMPGSDADLVIIDLETFDNVSAAKLHSAARHSIFEGRPMGGWPCMTVLGGEIVAVDRELVSRPRGRLIL